jgi:hypothetical protein
LGTRLKRLYYQKKYKKYLQQRLEKRWDYEI